MKYKSWFFFLFGYIKVCEVVFFLFCLFDLKVLFFKFMQYMFGKMLNGGVCGDNLVDFIIKYDWFMRLGKFGEFVDYVKFCYFYF